MVSSHSSFITPHLRLLLFISVCCLFTWVCFFSLLIPYDSIFPRGHVFLYPTVDAEKVCLHPPVVLAIEGSLSGLLFRRPPIPHVLFFYPSLLFHGPPCWFCSLNLLFLFCFFKKNCSVVDIQYYVNFRGTTQWMDKSVCYAVLPCVSPTLHHVTLLQNHWLCSWCTFYPWDLFIAWLEAWSSCSDPHPLQQPPVWSLHSWACLFVSLIS